MSKIEDWKAKKRTAEKLRGHAEKFQRRKEWDKLGGRVKIEGTYAGTYGSSSTYAWDTEIVKAMEHEAEQHFPFLADRAAARAEVIAETARKAAEDEARSVLVATSPTVVHTANPLPEGEGR